MHAPIAMTRPAVWLAHWLDFPKSNHSSAAPLILKNSATPAHL